MGPVSIYLYQSEFVIPTVFQAEAGFYLHLDPVYRVRSTDRHCVARALKTVLDLGTPVIPTPTFAKNAPPPVLLAVGQSSWRRFAKKSRSWSLSDSGDGKWMLIPSKLGESYSFVDDSPSAKFVGSDLTTQQIAEKAAALLAG